MGAFKTVIALAAGVFMAACATSIPGDQSVADYCASSDRAGEAVCRLNVEVDGNTTAIANTKLSLEEAQALAAAAKTSADEAGAAAAQAQASADAAMSRANQALNVSDLDCMTNTINQSAVGSCPTGYTVMGCSQTRYTHAAGGLSFLREVNNDQCRFNSKVLEMDVRCCRRASAGASQQSGMPDNS